MAIPPRVKLELDGGLEASVVEFMPNGVLLRCSRRLDLGAPVRISVMDPEGYDYWADTSVAVSTPELLGLELSAKQPAPVRQAFKRWSEAQSGPRRLEARLLSIPPPDSEALRALVADLE